MKLLIIDSHMESGEIYKSLAQDFELDTIDAGKNAVKYLLNNPVDAVITKDILPDMQGIKLAELIRQSVPDIPVFVAVEEPGLDIWQQVTAAKALVLPIPIDKNRIKAVCAKQVATITTLLSDDQEGDATAQEVAESEENRQDLPKPSANIHIPQKPRRKSRLKQHEHHCHIITVFSPKGGVGKTTTVVNLAAFMKTELGLRTAILELNRQTGNVLGHFQLNPSIDVSHWVTRKEWPNEDELEDYLVWCPNTEIAILPTQKLINEDTNKVKILPQHARGIVETLYPHFECLIIDGGTIIDDTLFQLMALSDQVVLVSIQNIETLQDCHYIPKMMQRRGIPDDKLVNVLNQYKRDIGISSQEALNIVGAARSHVIYFDKEVERVPKEKEPFIIRKGNKGKYFNQIRALAAKLIDHPGLQQKRSLLDRLKFWERSEDH